MSRALTFVAGSISIVATLFAADMALSQEKLGVSPRILKQQGMGPVGTFRNQLATELTAQECRGLGGRVVFPDDDRCGKLGVPYCRMPDTNAMCIDEFAQ